MLKKIKDFLGIEGVKIDLTIPEEVNFEEELIEGHIILNTLSDQKIHGIQIRLLERYSRGRKEKQLVNEYLLGLLELLDPIELKAGEEKQIQFNLEFVKMMSEMDKLEQDNYLLKGIIKLAKLAKKVKSTYRVEAKAIIRGVATHPIVSKQIKLV